MLNFPLIRSLLHVHGTAIPVGFSELDTTALKTINIEKTVTPPLEVINVNGSSTSLVEYITPVLVILQDSYLMEDNPDTTDVTPFKVEDELKKVQDVNPAGKIQRGNNG